MTPTSGESSLDRALEFGLRSDDDWLTTFMLARELQIQHDWDDYLLPLQLALDVMEVLTHNGARPFLVLNGITDASWLWLWLSPSAIRHLELVRPDILSASTEIRPWLSVPTRIDLRPEALLRVSQLELDAKMTKVMRDAHANFPAAA